MINDNKRYLGDVFINAENKEIQAQFFRDIIESYQGKLGGTFNAYSLWDEASQTEKLVSDFATAEQGLLAENSLQSPIRIGKKEIANIEDKQYIYTDATLLDEDNTELMKIDWFDGENSPLSEQPDKSLSSVLLAIRDAINIIQGALENSIGEKLDITTYENFYNNTYLPFQTSLSTILTEFTDEYGDQITRLNADMVNGLRFRVITQAKYDALDPREKNYWRNVFIIKDASEIPPDYEDPMQWEWEDGYEFRVSNNYLQFTNGLSEQWKTICSLEELLAGGGVENVVLNTLTNQTFTINTDTLNQSIKNISPTTVNNNWQAYPFLSSSLHDDFVESIKINNASTYVTTTLSNGFKIVNLDIDSVVSNALATVNTRIDGIDNTINNSSSGLQKKLSTAESAIQTIQGQISSLQGTDTSYGTRLTNIENQLATLNNTLTSINANINNLSNAVGKWEVANLGDLKNGDYQSKNYWNEKLGLAVVYFNFYAYNPASYGGEGWQFLMKNDKGHSYNTTQVKAVPLSNVAFVPVNPSPIGLKVYISSGDGEIYVYNPKVYSKNVKFHINGHKVYKYSKIQ